MHDNNRPEKASSLVMSNSWYRIIYQTQEKMMKDKLSPANLSIVYVYDGQLVGLFPGSSYLI